MTPPVYPSVTYSLEITTHTREECITLRVARHMLAQYIKLLRESMEKEEEWCRLPFGRLDSVGRDEDHGYAQVCLVAITPAQCDDGLYGSMTSSYEEHRREVLTVADLIRDKSNKEDEARRIKLIYQQCSWVTNDDMAKRYLASLDKHNEELLEDDQPSSLRKAFCKLMSLDTIDEAARKAFQHALITWQLPRGLVPEQPLDGQDDQRNKVDRSLSVDVSSFESFEHIFDLLQACSCSRAKFERLKIGVRSQTYLTELTAAAETIKMKTSSPGARNDTPPASQAIEEQAAVRK